jgi:hypothetical protein
MRKNDKPPRVEKPKDIAEDLAARPAFDRTKAHRENQRAVQAADRLLKEMDDVLKHLGRKA